MPWLSRLAERRMLKARLATHTDPAVRKSAMAELAGLEMRQTIAEESRRKFLR